MSSVGEMFGGDASKKAANYAQQNQAGAEANTAIARGDIAGARGERTFQEQRLADIENYLGTDTQLQHPEQIQQLAPYSMRYDTAEAQAPEISGLNKAYRKAYERSQDEWSTQRADTVKQANSLMDQAFAAAQSGDFAAADSLKAQANDLVNNFSVSGQPGKRANRLFKKYGSKIGKAYGIEPGQETLPANELTSPMGQGVGQLVKRGNELAGGPGTPGYENEIAQLENPALRQADIARMLGERQVRTAAKEAQTLRTQAGQRRGAARSVIAEAAQDTRALEAAGGAMSQLELQVGQMKAGIESSTRQFMETWQPQFSASTMALGRSYAEGAPGIRESYQNALTGLSMASAQINASLAQIQQQSAGQLQQLSASLKFQQMQLGADILAKVSDQIISVASMAGGGGMCHCAAVYFGWGTPDWYAARAWIMQKATPLFRAWYRVFAPVAAEILRNDPELREKHRPFFEAARDAGKELV